MAPNRDLEAALCGRRGLFFYLATVRMDTGAVPGIVGSRYVPVQNEDLFSFFGPVVDRDEGAF
jgi:hypothetical protein